jgi:hypothetical protein
MSIWPFHRAHEPAQRAEPQPLFARQQERSQMSDHPAETPAPEAPQASSSSSTIAGSSASSTSATPAASWTSDHFRAPTAPNDPMLRSALLNVGVQAGVLMLRWQYYAGGCGKRVGLPADTIYQIMTGREEDIGVRALNALAKLLNGKLVVQLVPDDQTRAA